MSDRTSNPSNDLLLSDLRDDAAEHEQFKRHASASHCRRAADEIERLERELEAIRVLNAGNVSAGRAYARERDESDRRCDRLRAALSDLWEAVGQADHVTLDRKGTELRNRVKALLRGADLQAEKVGQPDTSSPVRGAGDPGDLGRIPGTLPGEAPRSTSNADELSVSPKTDASGIPDEPEPVTWFGGFPPGWTGEWHCTCGRMNGPGTTECGSCHLQPHTGCKAVKTS